MAISPSITMIHFTRAASTDDLSGILALQRQNLPTALTEEEIRSQGFVTVVHSLADLERMNALEAHIIAKENDQVIAYVLAMTEKSKDAIPVLKPMFRVFRQLSFAGKPFSHYRYIVVGQVCVDKAYRGKGIFDAAYTFYRKTLQADYDFAITEIDATNQRSLAAHHRIGFQDIHRYTTADGKDWVIVLWDWNDLSKNNHSK